MEQTTFEIQEVQSATAEVEKLIHKINEMKQHRTNYLLQHFIICQHDTPGHQYLQILDELEALLFATHDLVDERELAMINLQETTEKIEKAKDKTKAEVKRMEVSLRKYNRMIIALEIEINARTNEIRFLLDLKNSMPEYTREQLEAEEPEYWRRRLSKQAFLAQRSATTGMGQGNLEAMIQSFTIPGKRQTILPLYDDEVIRAVVTGQQPQPPKPPLE